MRVNNIHYRTIWMEETKVYMIHQNELPFRFRIFESTNYKDTAEAIRDMIVRGAGAIGVAAGFAMAQAFAEANIKNLNTEFINSAKGYIENSRPTAQNLFFATAEVYNAGIKNGASAAIEKAKFLAEQDMQMAKSIGEFGSELINDNSKILTHCNAGWLGFVDYGSALSPIYVAHSQGKKLHVFADETRPRSQGARLTAWELLNEGISFDIIADNAAAHFMSKGEIDLVIVGADRIAANGDVANKIGTLEKAICAKYFNVPFYVAAPSSTFDINCDSGKKIIIEERSQDEVLYQTGLSKYGNLNKIMVCAPGSTARNPAFDITPAELITGIITPYGIIQANKQSIEKLLKS